MTQPSLFNQFLIWPIINLLLVLYKGLTYFKVPGAFGWAIILLTIFIRLLLSPLTLKQLVSAKKMAELKPQLDRLLKKYQHDKKRLQQEQLKLYQQAGVNPAAGCLPLLLQLPVLIALFRVFSDLLSNGDMNQLVSTINSILYHPKLQITFLDLSFFGLDLGVKPNQWRQSGLILLLVPIVTTGLQFIQSKLLTPTLPQKPPEKKTNKDKINSQQKGKAEASSEDELQKAMKMQMTYFMPILIGYFSLSFPVGLSLYWNTFTLFGIIQQVHLNKKRR